MQKPGGQLGPIYTYAEEHFRSVRDAAHDWLHVQRIFALATRIARAEGANLFIVQAGALLHDLGRAIPGAEEYVGEHHSQTSARLAEALLQAHGVDDATITAVLHVIVAHSYSSGASASSLEAIVVRDADRLDALGAVGIARTFTTGQILGSLLYESSDPTAQRRELDDRAYMLDHFYRKLLKLGDTLVTPTARALAGRRVAFLNTYIQEFERELAELT